MVAAHLAARRDHAAVRRLSRRRSGAWRAVGFGERAMTTVTANDLGRTVGDGPADASAPGTVAPDSVITIRPARGVTLGLRELVQHRELLYFLAWRDIKVRYKQTVLVAPSAVSQPMMT